MIHIIEYLKKRPQTVKLCTLFLGLAVFLWSISVDTSHGHTWLERHLPGFWSIFGIVSCVVLIFIARWYSSAGIEREEGYYDN